MCESQRVFSTKNLNKSVFSHPGIYEKMLAGSGVEVIKKRATLVDAHTVPSPAPLRPRCLAVSRSWGASHVVMVGDDENL